MAFNGRFLLNLLYHTSERGGNLEEFVRASGKSIEELQKEDCTIENRKYNMVIELAAEKTKDIHFGLHAGESLNLSAAGLIAQITQTSETVKQGLEYCCQFASLGCSALPINLKEEADYYKLTFTPNALWQSQSDEAVRHTAEGVLAFSIKEFHSLTRMKYYPLKLHLPWKKAKLNISEYERVFGCKTYLDQNEIALFFNKSHIEQKVVTADYELLRILVQHAQEKSDKIDQSNGFSEIVSHAVLRLLKPEFPSVDQVAQHLNISLRTLQRRLKEEGVIYKKLIDDLKKDFALTYLKNHELSISEIAYLLDYTDSSSFTRSFKRWTGAAPRAYRETLK